MTPSSQRPLHRVTPLRDDPAAAWLTRGQRVRVALTGAFGWFMFLVVMRLLFWAQVVLMAHVFPLPDYRLAGAFTGMAALALIWPVRRIIMRRKGAKMAALVRANSPALGAAVDDLDDLQRQPDGAAVSLVGWIKARVHLPQPVAGERCIGLALACHQKYPGVLETLSDFELVDEAGHAVLVQVAGARLLGESNVSLTDGGARMMLIASLELPVGAVPAGWDAFVLRDGDPVMVVGFKQSAVDPTQASQRAAPMQATVGSLPSKPLLIFPIAAERRPQAAAMFNLS